MLKSDGSITNKYQDLISNNTLKSKTEKSKDNKSLVFENEFNENAKHTKCQARNVKANKQTAQQATCNMQNKKDITASEKSDSAKDNAKVESIPPYEKSKKYNAKEAKEKKNKEDTRNKNRGSGGNNIMENKETVVQFARNKEQLHDQVHIPMQFELPFNAFICTIGNCTQATLYVNFIFLHCHEKTA